MVRYPFIEYTLIMLLPFRCFLTVNETNTSRIFCIWIQDTIPFSSIYSYICTIISENPYYNKIKILVDSTFFYLLRCAIPLLNLLWHLIVIFLYWSCNHTNTMVSLIYASCFLILKKYAIFVILKWWHLDMRVSSFLPFESI
jgi:hypothetical protein